MPGTPTWDDLLAATPLNLATLLERIRGAVAKLPDGSGAKEAEQAAEAELSQALSPENLTAAFSAVVPQLVAFVQSGGNGPVEKSPTDLV